MTGTSGGSQVRFGDFPTLADPRHADASSPLWDAQLGLWTRKAVKAGLNTRQIDENVVFNLALTRRYSVTVGLVGIIDITDICRALIDPDVSRQPTTAAAAGPGSTAVTSRPDG